MGSGVMERASKSRTFGNRLAAGDHMGQDTEIMSRYTLPKDATTETITFTVPDWEVQARQGDPDNPTLTVHMGFSSDATHKLSMRGYGDSSNFSDGLEIVDATKALGKLTLTLDSSWPEGWTITVDPDKRLSESEKVLDKSNRTHDLTIPTSGDWHVSVTISATSNGTTITTGDPKIKVIRPTS
jgi:hypothetical protein